jgi:protease-4
MPETAASDAPASVVSRLPLADRLRPKRDGRPLVLELDLTEPIMTEPPADPLAAFRARRRPRLSQVLDGLRRAAADDDVAGLIIQVSGQIGLARAQELRPAIAEFRRAGKVAVAWAETFGEFGPGSAGYLLAAACEEIWLQESGDLGLTGFGVEATFVKDALAKAGVRAQLGQRHEYKNAANMFVESGLTPAHREALDSLVSSAMAQLVEAVAADRSLEPDAVRALIDQAPLSPADALAGKLIDRVGYRDQVYNAVRERVGGEMRLRYANRYGPSPAEAVTGRVATRKGAVALIYGCGAIRLGRSGSSPTGGRHMGSTTVAAAFRAATQDDDVKAIVFRVDSPGGSYAASDAVRREVKLARQAGKPVIVSMGSVAGSGGYFVSMAADRIFALPATLTGSIGVFGGKAVVAELLDRIGIASGRVAEAAHALMSSPRQPYSDEEFAVLERWLDRVYADFTAKAAADRDMPVDRLRELARGRVWTGAEAVERGLIDELGGLPDAVAAARARGGLPERDDSADVRVLPHISPIERLRAPQSSEDPSAAAARLSGWGEFAGVADALGLPFAGPLTMPGWTRW